MKSLFTSVWCDWLARRLADRLTEQRHRPGEEVGPDTVLEIRATPRQLARVITRITRPAPTLTDRRWFTAGPPLPVRPDVTYTFRLDQDALAQPEPPTPGAGS